MMNAPKSLQELAQEDNRGLRRRLAFGISSQFLTTAVLIGSRFLLVPLYLYAWGVDGFADWLVLMAASMAASFWALGQQWRYGNALREAWAHRDVPRFEDVFGAAQSFWLLMLLGLIAALSGFLLAFDVTALLNLRTLGRLEASISLVALCVAAFGLCYREFLRSVHQARGEFTRTEVMGLCGNVVAVTTTAIALGLFKAPILVAALIQPMAGFVLVSLLFLMDGVRRYPDLHLGLRWTRRHLPRRADLYVYGVPNGGEWLSSSAPTLILGLVNVPGVQIAQYGVARTVGIALRIGLRQIGKLFAFEIIRQHTQGDRAGMQRLHMVGGGLLGLAVGGAFGFLVASWDVIVGVWTGGEVPVDLLLLILILTQLSSAGLGELVSGLLRYGHHTRDLAYSTTLCALGYLVFAYGMAAAYGAYGLVATVSLLDALFFFIVPAAFVHYRFGLPAWRSLGLPALTGGIAGLTSYVAVDFGRGLFGV